jgi:hypothetical protein
MILHPSAAGPVAVLQPAHALLAFQLADHWGNRLTPRPSPRAEVLAAVLLHDAGWSEVEDPPRLAADGRPWAFDTLPAAEREAVWAAAVDRAAPWGAYVAYLVSHHVSSLAGTSAGGTHAGFLAQQDELRARLRDRMGRDRRLASVVSTTADAVNRGVVRLADAIAVAILVGGGEPVRMTGLPRRGGSSPLTITPVAPATWRLRPWPFVGRRLTATAEGRLLPASQFADEASLKVAWRDAAAVRLAWTLLAPGAPSD